MKIERKLLKRVSLEDFADQHGLTLEVWEDIFDNPLYGNEVRVFAKFKGISVKDGESTMVSTIGDGADEDKAIRHYIKKISGRTIVKESEFVHGCGPDRVPFEVHVPFLRRAP